MKKTIYTFNLNNSANTSFPKSTDYSKTLDAIIHANIKKANPYLNCCEEKGDFYTKMIASSKGTNKTLFISGTAGIIDADFLKAAKFLANYNKTKNDIKSKFIIGKTYHLTDGTPIIFYDDEIQIGFDLYSYSEFANTTFIKALPATTKSIIINIFNIIL